MKEFLGQKVVLGYSGGPDATALAYKLATLGSEVVPVYVDYRKTSGGKTSKDLRAARASLTGLGIAGHSRATWSSLKERTQPAHRGSTCATCVGIERTHCCIGNYL